MIRAWPGWQRRDKTPQNPKNTQGKGKINQNRSRNQILSKASNNQPEIATERACLIFLGKGDILEGV